jgi:hypothetical protein
MGDLVRVILHMGAMVARLVLAIDAQLGLKLQHSPGYKCRRSIIGGPPDASLDRYNTAFVQFPKNWSRTDSSAVRATSQIG